MQGEENLQLRQRNLQLVQRIAQLEAAQAANQAELPAADAPAAEVPAAELPAPELPAPELPAAEVPAAEVPAAEAPAAELPAPEPTAAEVPAVELAPVEMTAPELPAVEPPAVKLRRRRGLLRPYGENMQIGAKLKVASVVRAVISDLSYLINGPSTEDERSMANSLLGMGPGTAAAGCSCPGGHTFPSRSASGSPLQMKECKVD
ncbi:hypothetical protein GPECTOR_4g846 [Gonium pectorale]|uniref:Uncharacterized protein n=1 Tax=Gonium pectorale TaxID=33097 RepID=A0A150GXY7_GONPE|nr:hypothetical protein GPECTOR_4g846 [Gonium pectorale]|eukprot:KXZ54776.1 hypothetical protein GPECTOR_4g846 [Gonium pectorale]